MIVDLSFPHSRSVNDGIHPDLAPLQYASVDDTVRFIHMLGRGTLLIKIDLKNAYRLVPVHPQDRYLLDNHWNNSLYVDQALPFGLRSAPKLFTAVADAIVLVYIPVKANKPILREKNSVRVRLINGWEL